jgi:hypothetical protein
MRKGIIKNEIERKDVKQRSNDRLSFITFIISEFWDTYKIQKILFTVLCTMFLFTACTRNRIMISGVIENYDKSCFVLKQILPDEVLPVDTVLVLNGKFSYRLKSNQVGVYLLQFNDTLFTTFIANPDDELVFYADVNNLRQTYDVQGNEETKLLIENQRKLEQLYQKTKLLSDRFIRFDYKDNFDSLTRELDSIYAVNFDNHKKYLTDFILSHPDKLASLMAFYQLLGNNAFFSMEEDRKLLDSVYPILSKTYPESIYIDDLKEKLSGSDD